MTLAELEKTSGVAHATLFDIYSGKTDFKKCSIEVALKLAKALDMDVNELYNKLTFIDYSDLSISRSFDLYRSNILHKINKMDHQSFIDLYQKEVKELIANNEYDKALYLMTIINELVSKYHLRLDEDYSEYKDYRLDKFLIPTSIYLRIKTHSINIASFIKQASKAFLKRNIFEEKIIYE